MNELITAIIAVILGIVLILIMPKMSEKSRKWTLRAISLLLVFVFIFRALKTNDIFDNVSGLNTNAISDLGYFTQGDSLMFIILRWLTMYSVLFCILAPWYKIRIVDNFVSLFTPIIIVLNIIFLNLTLTGYIGVAALTADTLTGNALLRVVEFIAEIGIMGGMSIYYLFRKIATKDFNIKGLWKEVLIMLGIIVFFAYILMPESSLTNLFGHPTVLKVLGGDEDYSYYVMDMFDLGNRILFYLIVVIMFSMYFILRKKEEQVRHFALTAISVGVIISFCYSYSLKFSVSSLPLHLCNAGTILCMFAFIFRSKPLFYFNFLINVLGSIISLVAANTSAEFISAQGVHYYLTHMWLCILPCMGIALHLFPRPTFGMMKGAVLVFTIYFLLVCCLNPWFNNYSHGANYIETGENPGIDYFFIQSDFLTDKFDLAETLKKDYSYHFTIKGLTMWVYPVFWAAVYVVYVAATFGTWFMYNLLFSVGDRHYDMLVRKRKRRADLLGIANAGRINLENSEPLNKEGVNMIKFNHFSKRYGNSKVKAVDDFNLEIKDGEVFGFIGHNGAGKSTCIKSLVGIQSITEGSIEVCGYDIAKQPLPAKMLLGYVPDNHAVYERLTGREYINYVADLYRVSIQDREERLEKYLDIFKLKGDIDRQIKGYSHGMKQKIVVIAALIHDPKVWVLDEPLTGLDPTSSFQIKECMREHANKGNIVFFSSHVIEVVEKICDRIAIISKGKLQCVHSIKELHDKGIALEDLYMQYVKVVDDEMLHEVTEEVKKEKPNKKSKKNKTTAEEKKGE